MLHTLTDDGYLGWRCDCGEERQAHISEVQLQEYDGPPMPVLLVNPSTGKKELMLVSPQRSVRLPRCACGTGFRLKIDWAEEELAAPNLISPITGKPTPTHAAALRHMRLAALLEANKNTQNPASTSEQGGDHVANQ